MGAFYSKNNRPYFSPEDGIEYEIRTEESLGPDMVIESEPVELKPHKYYSFGTVSKHIKIARLQVVTTKYLETYAGEFTIAEGGKVTFPSVVRWTEEPKFDEVGFTYQFEIKNGIGKFVKVQ